ncbi:MAG: LCP family protein [bacterium]|nr:LCP family protein [bacterium]
MSDDNNKKEIKTIDFNDNSFFNEGESHFVSSMNNTKKDTFLTKLVTIAVLLSFCIIALVVFVPFDKLNAPRINKYLKGEEFKEQNSFDIFKKRENILVLGVDSNGDDTDPFENTRTDTIMIVSLDKASKTANIVSVPRDSKVYIDGHGIDKINSAHALGGIELALKTIQSMFGVRIDHYILINYEGLKEIVKVLGTIPVNVDKKMRYTDRAGHLYVNLEPGKQELDAEQVEQFARFRHDAVGDIGRMERQRMLIQGILTKLQSPESISKLPEVISVAGKYVKTDMTIFDLTRYAGVAKNINTDNLVMATLPGHPSQNSYISYWILEPDKVQNIIDRLVYRIEEDNPQAGPLMISILYNASLSDKIDEIKAAIEENNMKVICMKETKKSNPEVIAHKNTLTTTKYKYLKNILPQLKKAPMTISYDLFYCDESDVTLVLAE